MNISSTNDSQSNCNAHKAHKPQEEIVSQHCAILTLDALTRAAVDTKTRWAGLVGSRKIARWPQVGQVVYIGYKCAVHSGLICAICWPIFRRMCFFDCCACSLPICMRVQVIHALIKFNGHILGTFHLCSGEILGKTYHAAAVTTPIWYPTTVEAWAGT